MLRCAIVWEIPLAAGSDCSRSRNVGFWLPEDFAPVRRDQIVDIFWGFSMATHPTTQ